MPFICVRRKIAENWEKSMRHETIGCFCHSVRCEGVPGGGGPCSVVPFKNWHLFPCSHIYFPLVPCFSNLLFPLPLPPPPLESRLGFALKSLILTDIRSTSLLVMGSCWYIFLISLFALGCNGQWFQMLLLSVKSTHKISCSLHHRFQFQMTNELSLKQHDGTDPGLWWWGLKAEASMGYRGMFPREILKIRSSEMRFLAFWGVTVRCLIVWNYRSFAAYWKKNSDIQSLLWTAATGTAGC